MIIKPEEMKFADKNIVMILYGAPGMGKTTLGCSAPKPLVLDVDNGMCRVNAAHRKDAANCNRYEDVLADINDGAKAGYESLIIDTVGALLDLMKEYIIRTNPKMSKSDGSLSLQGFGALKTTFLDFSAMVRRLYKNTVFTFHEVTERNGDDNFYGLMCEGSAKNLVWMPCDIGCRYFLMNGKRYLGFTPTEAYNAKGCYGISGLIEVPTLADGDENNFLGTLFDRIRNNLASEANALAPKKADYEAAMADGMKAVNAVEKPEDVAPALEYIKGIKHGLTSEKELTNALKKRMAELGITYNKATKAYEYAEK